MRLLKLSAVNLVLMATLIVLGACAAKPARDVDSHYDIAVAVPAITYGTQATIMLRRVDIRGIQSGRSLVQIIDSNPVRYQEERGHYWHVSAPTLLERSITDALSASSADASFGTSTTMQDADYRYSIDMRLFAYEPNGNARVMFGAVIKDRKGKIILSSDYEGAVKMATAAPADAVNALGAALSAALEQMANDLANAI